MKIPRLKFINSLFVVNIILLNMISLTVWSGIFVDNFNDKKADDWKQVGIKWKFKDGGYHGINPDGVEGAALIGDPKWGPNYSIEVKVRNAKGVWLGIHLRWLDTDHHYDWWIDMNNKKACLYIKKGTYTQKTIDDIPLDINKEFTIKLAIEGFVLSGYFNDKLVNKWQDEEQSFETGVIGLDVWEAEATFDDIVIEGKNVPGNLAVNSQKKLALTWGRIRSDFTIDF